MWEAVRWEVDWPLVPSKNIKPYWNECISTESHDRPQRNTAAYYIGAWFADNGWFVRLNQPPRPGCHQVTLPFMPPDCCYNDNRQHLLNYNGELSCSLIPLELKPSMMPPSSTTLCWSNIWCHLCDKSYKLESDCDVTPIKKKHLVCLKQSLSVDAASCVVDGQLYFWHIWEAFE